MIYPSVDLIYHLNPEVLWLVNSDHIVVYADGFDGQSCEISGPEAALWDMIARKVPEQSQRRVLAAVLGLSARECSAWVNDVTRRWAKDRLICSGVP